jgi:hypothetical protein
MVVIFGISTSNTYRISHNNADNFHNVYFAGLCNLHQISFFFSGFTALFSLALAHLLKFLNRIQLDARLDSSGRVISPSHRPLPTQGNTKHKHKKRTSMPRAEFEPAIPATKWLQTYALECAATGIGK